MNGSWIFTDSFFNPLYIQDNNMWTWSLNWGQITNSIIIGTCPMAPGDLKRIRAETGVSGVLSLQHDDCLSYWGINCERMCRTGTKLGLSMKRSPIRDFDVPGFLLDKISF